jgi:long-subunit acyl-CoA synthetase (AMP-forming)
MEVCQPAWRSCSQSIPGTEVLILDADIHELPSGAIGEVVARGPNVMLGYWNKPEQTAAVLREGAYSAGDLG